MSEPSFIIKPILLRMQEYFTKDIGIDLQPNEAEIVRTSHIELLSYSVLINLSGGVNGGFIFTVEKSLGERLLELFSEVEISPEDRDEFVGEALAESLNIIIGNSYHLIPCGGEKIKFSPPLGLGGSSSIENYKQAHTTKGEFSSKYGRTILIYIDYSETLDEEK
ncbi:MAG: chemotaxis protein CheX [Campylobacteraceae bacterium]|nr:chemotaxis protein CheX [Campylobacteraceae bacterium]